MLVDPDGEEWVEVGDVHGINNSSSLNLTLPSLPQKKHTREQMIESKLSSVKVGESISGTELAEAIGIKKISLAVNKITRTGESTFSVDRKLLGKSFLKDSPLKISKEKLKIDGKEETVYRVQIQYTKAAERMNMLSDFYINNDDILYYDKNGKLCKGSDH